MKLIRWVRQAGWLWFTFPKALWQRRVDRGFLDKCQCGKPKGVNNAVIALLEPLILDLLPLPRSNVCLVCKPNILGFVKLCSTLGDIAVVWDSGKV